MDRQKIIMIFAAAWVSAALLTWLVFSRATSANSEKMVEVYAAANDLPAGTRVKKSDLKKVRIPEKDAPKYVVLNEASVLDRVLLLPVSAGEPLVAGKTTTSGGAEGVASLIQPGLRAISIPVTDTTAAGGLIQPRSKVDVLFTRTGSMREAITATIAQDVQVMSIGRLTEVNTIGPDGKPVSTTAPSANAGTQTRAAVLLVTPEQASKIELAKNQGKVSLVLRNPLDRNAVETASATAESLDPDIFAGTARALKANASIGKPPVNVRDDKAWASLTGGEGAAAAPRMAEKKELPKPKYVVDVYHGDKHVQELFQ